MDELAKKKCIPCEKKGIKAFDRTEAERYAAQVHGWILSDDAKKIEREFVFKDFIGSIDFINAIADNP